MNRHERRAAEARQRQAGPAQKISLAEHNRQMLEIKRLADLKVVEANQAIQDMTEGYQRDRARLSAWHDLEISLLYEMISLDVLAANTRDNDELILLWQVYRDSLQAAYDGLCAGIVEYGYVASEVIPDRMEQVTARLAAIDNADPDSLRRAVLTTDQRLGAIYQYRTEQAPAKATKDRAVNYARAVVYRRLHEIEADPLYAGQHTKAADHYLSIIGTMAGLGTELSPGDQAARRWLEEQKTKGGIKGNKPYADNLSNVYLDKDQRLAGYEVGELPALIFTE